MALNEMKITQKGLSTVGDILINNYTYNGDINKVGSVLISPEGIASQFNTTPLGTSPETYKYSYVYKSDLSLGLSTTLNIEMEAQVLLNPKNPTQVLFSLRGDSDIINLFITSNKVILSIDGTNVVILDAEFINQSYMSFKVILTKSTAQVILNTGTEIITSEEATLGSTLLFDNFNTIIIGNITSAPNYFWLGSVDLSKFFIKSEKEILESPTIKNAIKFTNILIATKDFELTDGSKETLGKAISFPVEEITRTNSSVLIRVTIPENSYLNIGAIGLYCLICDKYYLFSKITGLDIQKNNKVKYDLLFHVKLDINVVNTTIRPEIVLKPYTPETYTDFDDVRKIFLHTNIDLERIIKANAKQIGFNTAQVFYQKERKISFNHELWISALRALSIQRDEDLQPIDFFNIPNANKHSFTVANMFNSPGNGFLYVTDGSFISTNSTIDFSKDSSLVLKMKPLALGNRLILSKIDFTTEEVYFTLSIHNTTLLLTVYTEEDILTLEVSLTDEQQQWLSIPFLLCIISDNTNNRISLLINEQELGSVSTEGIVWPDVSAGYSISNHIDITDAGFANIQMSDILYFSKILSVSDIYQLRTIMDCVVMKTPSNR